MFRFNYRQAGDSLENFARRNNRMIERHLQRYEASNMKEVLTELNTAVSKNAENTNELTKKWVDFQLDEAVNQYKDYFESDKEDDLFLMEEAKQFDRETLLSMYDNVL